MNNVCEAGQHGGFHFLFMEPMQHIKIISDFCPRYLILVCEKLVIINLQDDCFSRKRVPLIRVVMEVEGLLVVAH